MSFREHTNRYGGDKNKSMKLSMELYETDIYELQKFIADEKTEEFTDKYLILYNFAIDCKCAEYIQPELIRFLLPFYLKTMEEAIFFHNKIAVDIYCEFNLSVFYNKKRFRNSVGEISYRNIITYYIEQTIKKMEMHSKHTLDWVSLFNTTIALYEDSIEEILCRIFQGSLKIKYSFFHYLSVLLFKENDNILALNETRAFWTSEIWDFDDGYFSRKLFWSDYAVNFFNKEINKERIKKLFIEVKPLLCDVLEIELVDLLHEELNHSFATGFFENRKTEFLKKINCVSEEQLYWETTF